MSFSSLVLYLRLQVPGQAEGSVGRPRVVCWKCNLIS